jgi:hypothetical protein
LRISFASAVGIADPTALNSFGAAFAGVAFTADLTTTGRAGELFTVTIFGSGRGAGLGGALVAFVAGGLLELDAVAGVQVAVDVALDGDGPGVDVGLHLGFLGNVEAAGRADLALELPMEPHALLVGQLPLKGGVGPENGGELLIRGVIGHGVCLLRWVKEMVPGTGDPGRKLGGLY